MFLSFLGGLFISSLPPLQHYYITKKYTKSRVILHENKSKFLYTFTRKKVQKTIDITRIRVYTIVKQEEHIKQQGVLRE